MPKQLGFFPDEKTLNATSLEQLKLSYIKQIACHQGSYLYRLTFIFRDGTRSPPQGSYNPEPSKTFGIAKGNSM
jgi:hypothetical protein